MMGHWTLVRLAWLLGVALFVAGCSDDDGGGPVAPDPSTVPEVVVTRPVGNPSVDGALELVPRAMATGEAPWRFEVDLDGDGAADASGEVSGVTSVPFSFEAPGLHPLRVVFTRGSERVEVERSVNVLDPDRIEILATMRIDLPDLTSSLTFEGIAVDRAGTAVYAGAFGLVFKLDAATLTLQDTVWAPPTNTLEGFAIAPDEELLYVVSKFLDLWLVDLEAFKTVAFLEGLASGQYYLEALPGRRVYSSGEGNLALIDVESGTRVRELALSSGERAQHSALSPSGDRIAVIVATIISGGVFPERLRRLALVDPQLNEIGQTEPTDLFLEHVAWSPSGDRIYVRYGVNDRRSDRCGILTLNPMTLEVLEDVPLAVDGGCMAREFGRGVANPTASTPDGRFLVFPAPGGAFVFDTVEDRPVARTPASAGGGTFNFCCDVAASPNEDVFYVAASDGWLTKFRFIRED